MGAFKLQNPGKSERLKSFQNISVGQLAAAQRTCVLMMFLT
jgi:hypothetical protein